MSSLSPSVNFESFEPALDQPFLSRVRRGFLPATAHTYAPCLCMAHAYIRMDGNPRTRQLDRNGDAARRVDRRKARDHVSASEVCASAFPFLVQDACAPRDSRTRTRKGDVSGGARLEQSHGRATRGGSSPPSARRRHSARDFRTRSAQRLSSGIEWLPGPPSRILHPGHGLEILEPSQTETPPATAG